MVSLLRITLSTTLVLLILLLPTPQTATAEHINDPAPERLDDEDQYVDGKERQRRARHLEACRAVVDAEAPFRIVKRDREPEYTRRLGRRDERRDRERRRVLV